MRNQPALTWLVPLIVVLALIAAGAGLFTPQTGAPFTFNAVRGDRVQIHGQGLYRLETPIAALGFRAADFVTLVLAVPLLIAAFILYRRGSLKGGLLLAGALAYFLYNYISMGFGAVYNNFFLVYVLLFSASLFAFVAVMTSFDLASLPAHFSDRLPRRGIAIYLMVSGVVLSLVWLALSILPALFRNDAPMEARYYTTFITGTLDLGLISPALIAAGGMLLRRQPVGYLLSAVLLAFTVVLGVNLTAGGAAQVLAKAITPGQAMVFTLPFVVLTLFALWFTTSVLRALTENKPARASRARR